MLVHCWCCFRVTVLVCFDDLWRGGQHAMSPHGWPIWQKYYFEDSNLGDTRARFRIIPGICGCHAITGGYSLVNYHNNEHVYYQLFTYLNIFNTGVFHSYMLSFTRRYFTPWITVQLTNKYQFLTIDPNKHINSQCLQVNVNFVSWRRRDGIFFRSIKRPMSEGKRFLVWSIILSIETAAWIPRCGRSAAFLFRSQLRLHRQIT